MIVTLKNLADASAQQVFDQAVGHLRKQGQRSIAGGACAYRSGTLKCAAGALIADDEYVLSMDMADSTGNGTSWNSLIRRGLVPSTKHDLLIVSLQQTHDSGDDTDRWENRFKVIAEEHDLVYTPRAY